MRCSDALRDFKLQFTTPKGQHRSKTLVDLVIQAWDHKEHHRGMALSLSYDFDLERTVQTTPSRSVVN